MMDAEDDVHTRAYPCHNDLNGSMVWTPGDAAVSGTFYWCRPHRKPCMVCHCSVAHDGSFGFAHDGSFGFWRGHVCVPCSIEILLTKPWFTHRNGSGLGALLQIDGRKDGWMRLRGAPIRTKPRILSKRKLKFFTEALPRHRRQQAQPAEALPPNDPLSRPRARLYSD